MTEDGAAASVGRRVAIIGAGVSGIAVAHTLRAAGIPFTIFEKAAEAGGTWRENHYPGLKCDVPLFFYCFSFAPGQAGWRNLLAPGDEIQRQLLAVLDEQDLRKEVRFDSAIVECRWEGDHWDLLTASGERHEYDVVVHATGFLHKPRWPDIKGLDTFSGPVLHSAQWDDSVDLEGKRVGVVGTGSTGTQLVSALAGHASHVTLIQRTAQWVFPLPDTKLPRPMVAMLTRSKRLADLTRRASLRATAWFVGTAAIQLDSRRRKAYCWLVRKHLETVKDPELRGKLTPSYPPLCKRPVMSWSFYKAVQRPDVSVVASGIDHVEAKGIVTPDGTLHEVDVVALATGFEAHAYMRPMKIIGIAGVTLDETWSEGVFSFRSIALPGFPNMFMIMGPNACLSHVGVHETAEWQAGYIVDAVRALSEPGTVSITPSQQATDKWLADLGEALPSTVWAQCTSWYSVGGKNGLPVMWPWSRDEFAEMMRRFDSSEYDVQVRTVAQPIASGD